MQNDYQQGARRAPKEPVINRWEGEGVVRPRSGNDGDEIRFFPFKNGGGAIHISIECTETTGADQNGQPRTITTYVPVNVMANRLIPEQQLKAVRPGMRVRAKGRLQQESYTSKKDGSRRSTMVVNAFVFEIIDMQPQAVQQPGYAAQPGYAPQGQYPPQQPVYPPQQPGYMPGYAPQGQYPPQQPAYPPQQPGYPVQQPGYAPQGQYPPQQPAYQQPGYAQAAAAQHQGQRAPAQGQQVPPYYQAPTQQPPAPPIEDMPPGPGETINL